MAAVEAMEAIEAMRCAKLPLLAMAAARGCELQVEVQSWVQRRALDKVVGEVAADPARRGLGRAV